ncbi:serine/threonine protein kinase [Murinocardiopsis flavida]|uniref:mitogen-activated protein kinase kinase n=1 Tax=Murinocardiopsis flavida TaxID=645275 RepID=A0A2P8DI06_9ACTN|nr:protein kinase [Murinocardiopsis flavida]PSK96831.1 serine/threonine protein kinase [Murinocardiopsis flavida]
MATPEPSDPAAPTTQIEAGRTRWVTRILRPGEPAAAAAPAAAPSSDAEPTAVRPAAAPRTRRLGAPRGDAGGRKPARKGVRLPGAVNRMISRAVTGPAAELDYAVPAELRRSYEVVDHIGSGGEAVVYLAHPTGDADRSIALKIYRPGHDINRELLDRLRARGAADPHTPAIHGYGYAGSVWGEQIAWEAQEYFAAGSLRAVMDDAPLPEERARAVVGAVAECLRHWQETLQHNHTDVKPENLLVRGLDPPVFALTDFGGAVRATMSRVYGGLAITEDYAAPEVVEGRREAAAAWWSLGIMVHELTTGRRPARGENWLSARSTEIDVSAITDDRWRLLARGLLTPVPSARWGYEQVRQWLAGERPEVVKPRRHAPILFADVNHEDPPSLAFDLLDRSDKGEVWLRTHWPSLRTWLDREVNDYTFDRAYLTSLAEHPERAHLAISALAARFVPGMPPRYRGHEVSAEGVLAMATGESSRFAVLREAVEMGALSLAARHFCDHPECRAQGTNRCALLERVQHEVPLIVDRTRSTVEGLGQPNPAGLTPPEPHEWDAAWAHAAELVLDPEAPSRYRRRLRAQSWHPAQRSDAPRSPWWREQRTTAVRGDDGTVATNAAFVTAVLMLPSATRAGGAQRERDRLNGKVRRQALLDRARQQVGRSTGSGEGARENRELDPAARAARVERGMRQIRRAMGSGRCRRFAYPAALLGVLDGVGGLLYPAGGYYTDVAFTGDSIEGVRAFSGAAPVDAVSTAASAVLSLLPGGVALMWGFPLLLAIALVLLGRTAANQQRKARTQLISYRLALAGSALMAVRLLASGLFLLCMGVLIPLDLLLS